MTYTPINWQTGDTITAEKMNKMDNGWSVESGGGTQLFSETVVTENDGDLNYGVLSYSEEVPDGALTVTFDGTDYTCTCSDTEFGSTDESFEDYPFFVFWSGKAQNNAIETATEGTHTIAVSAGGGETIETSSDFSAAVNNCIQLPRSVLVVNVYDLATDMTWNEINDEFVNGVVCIVLGYGPVFQMWVGRSDSLYYMATGCNDSSNGAFDPMIWRTAGASADLAPNTYKYNSLMP